MEKDEKLWMKDEKDNMGRVIISDVFQSNGVLPMIDTEVVPK